MLESNPVGSFLINIEVTLRGATVNINEIIQAKSKEHQTLRVRRIAHEDQINAAIADFPRRIALLQEHMNAEVHALELARDQMICKALCVVEELAELEKTRAEGESK
ncbi:hypothetical protein KAR91_07650 [Candidatus Pacearchaeota archaeon]|nr:hypothetical protein [Candidatus Pacearchaeota archaeon]